VTAPNFDQSFLPVLDGAFDTHAERICLQFGEQRFTYREVDETSRRVANRLIRAGFEKGMKGAIYSLNSAVSFIATVGLIRAGGIWIPVNPRNSAVDNVNVVNNLGCDAIFFQHTFEEPVAAVINHLGGMKAEVCLDDEGLTKWLGDAPATHPNVTTGPQDLITIPMTGGTTGLPKGVMLSNRNFCALNYGMSHNYADREPVVLIAAPMTHAAGRGALTSLSTGARTVVLEQVDPQLVLETIEKEHITDFFLPPTAFYTLLDQPNVNNFDYSRLKRVSYGSAPMSVDKIKECLRVFGPVMRGGFGQTECPMFISSLEAPDHFIDGEIAPDERLRSVGKATVISELTIVDDNVQPLPAGERGEIAVKGPMVSEGYYEHPEETAKIRVNGWHLTGDIGFLDKDGYLYIVDRKKDMIITGGFNVYSAEVEHTLMTLPGVKVAVVIGIPSEKWGEQVHALIQPEKGAPATDSEIMARTKEMIGSVKAPKSVEFVDDFPRTAVHKIDKKAVRQAYWEGQSRTL
jgi:acyl-CoA synthetase (AMP-forming)/AMP-acid ligase II